MSSSPEIAMPAVAPHWMLPVGSFEGSRKGCKCSFGHYDCFVGVVDGVADDDELVAADAGDRVASTDSVVEAFGGFDQDLVAGGVAMRVVDRFEVVEVEVADGHVLGRAGSAGERLGQLLGEGAAVEQVGEWIV